ncbi:uncharacterized protein LOC112093558 [Morus notabilis]|uniref:uncharacterized protein LOC112093558 n=1 Tax=Morus notabilis TaxID=981085 RepID=UPI000CED282B|nr:uncharacterized protein LOC112093558 [Morus notabilis]
MGNFGQRSFSFSSLLSLTHRFLSPCRSTSAGDLTAWKSSLVKDTNFTFAKCQTTDPTISTAPVPSQRCSKTAVDFFGGDLGRPSLSPDLSSSLPSSQILAATDPSPISLTEMSDLTDNVGGGVAVSEFTILQIGNAVYKY